VKKPAGDEKVRVETAGITFIATGAFAGLEDVLLRRLLRTPDLDGRTIDEEAYRHLGAHDLVAFGLLPEFVARFPVRAGLTPLSREQLDYLLTESPTSPLRQLTHLFFLHGIELVVEAAARGHLLDRALAECTGARALLEVLNDRLLHVMNALPELLVEGVARVIVDEGTIEKGLAPWKIAGEGGAALVDLEKLARLAEQPRNACAAPGITNTKGWSDAAIRGKLESVKAALDWAGTTGGARRWWEAFERDNSHRLGLVLRLAEELLTRKATVTEFFLAYVYSNTDNIQANLHYLDFTRLKKEEERTKREQARAGSPARFRTGDACPGDAAGAFQFDGYLDGSTGPSPPAEQLQITLAANQLFPASSAGKPCWWKRSGGGQGSGVRSQGSGVSGPDSADNDT
jgi:hypothetical protein